MKLHPACGCPTPFIAKVIAICDLIFGLVGIFWFVYVLEGYDLLMKEPSSLIPTPTDTPPIPITPFTLPHSNHSSINVTDHVEESGNDSIFSVSNGGIQINGKNCNIVLSAFYTIVNLFAFVLLLSAASDKNICKLKTWFAIRLFIFLLKCFLYVTYAVLGAALYDQIPHILFMGLHLYGLWVVGVFIQEIQEERGNTKRLSDSTATVPYTPKEGDKA